MDHDERAGARLRLRAACRRALVLSGSVLAAAPLLAQAPADGATEGSDLEAVVVTGSRISQTGFTTPTPVTVLGAEQIEQLSITNIGAGVSQLPAFRASNTPTTNGWGSFNVGAQIVNLRGLGVNRNLVLVDGRRFAPVTREGTVDLNLIPSALVERTDIVTGGASAAYGSDAIAGVVNVILDKDLTGIKAQADYGVSEEGDGDNFHFALAGGAGLFDGRGHFILGGEYDKTQGIGDCFTRDYCEGGVTVSNAGVAATPGGPANVRTDAGGGFFANTNGVIAILNNNATPLQGQIRNLFGTGGVTFDDNGTPIPYTLGSPASGNSALNGDVVSGMTTAQLLVPVERWTTYGHMFYDVSDNVRAFVEGSYGHVEGDTLQSRYFGAPIAIYADNPYVPASIRALIGAPPTATPGGTRPAAATFNVAVLGPERGHSSSEADSYRFTTGLNGGFGESSWRWDGYYQYAQTERTQMVEDLMVVGASRVINRPGSGGLNNPGALAYFQWATDAVYNPADAALPAAQRRITCRALVSTDAALRAAAEGCVPYNPFGINSISDGALDYVYRTLLEDIDIDQHVAAANVQGELLQAWAGPLQIASGVEYRRDSTALVHDPLSNEFVYFQNFGADYSAAQDVWEVYLEGEMPLLQDVPFARSLRINAAARHTWYDIAGVGSYDQAPHANTIDETSWKVGLLWDPLDWLRLRATQSRDIRAPNFNELFQASASTFTPVINRFVGNASQNPALLTGGNPNLDAEKADTTTFGVVFSPQWEGTQNLRFSADYFDIKVNGYIGAPGAQNVVDRCFEGEQMFCSLITFGPGQSLAEVANINVNLQWLKSRGIDLEADYRLGLGSLPGQLGFRLLATHTMESATNLFGQITDRAGETGGGGATGVPDWLVNLYTSYTTGGVSLNLGVRYIPSGSFNAFWTGPDNPAFNPALNNTVNDNHVASAVYLNFNGSYTFIDNDSQRVQIFASVANLLDKAPPAAPSATYPSNPVYFDHIGRTYRAGVRVNF